MSQLRKIKEEQIRQSQEMQRAKEEQEAQVREARRQTQQIPLSPEEEVAEIKLKNAFKLMKEERYTAARLVLRDLHDNPKAEAMLALMEGKIESRKVKPAISKTGVFMMFFMLTCVGGAIIAALLFQEAISQFSLDDLFKAGAGGEMMVYASLSNYCAISTNMQQHKCLQWPIEVFTDYPTAVEVCIRPYSSAAILDKGDVRSIRNCFDRYGVPAPY
jgi:hypothetical protein